MALCVVCVYPVVVIRAVRTQGRLLDLSSLTARGVVAANVRLTCDYLATIL